MRSAPDASSLGAEAHSCHDEDWIRFFGTLPLALAVSGGLAGAVHGGVPLVNGAGSILNGWVALANVCQQKCSLSSSYSQLPSTIATCSRLTVVNGGYSCR
jgi:hypothetical protein